MLLKNQRTFNFRVCIDSTSPPLAGGYTTLIFQQNSASLNSEFSFSYTGFHIKNKEPHLPDYLPIAEGRKDGFMAFLKALAQTVLLRIWTQVSRFISKDDNHYATDLHTFNWYINAFSILLFEAALKKNLVKHKQPSNI